MSSSRLLAAGGNPIAIARARNTLVERDPELDALTAYAIARYEAGALESAAAWAQIACHAGWARPGTRLAVPRLEEMLAAIGRACADMRRTRTTTDDPRRVLHVMTESYSTGGHTRVVERWAERDWREATVVLTDQRAPLPENMVTRLRDCGATLIPRLTATDLIGRARELRALALDHDLVVLHTHMHDVVPAIAFAEASGRPPVVLFEHASHQLWIGCGAADVIACMREVEAEIAHRQRGFPHERIRILPIPHASRELPTRAEARARIGWDDEVPVVLSVASHWKVRPVLEPSFATICDAVLTGNPSAKLLVVGPLPDEQWTGVARRHGDRLLMPGPVAELAPLLAAADVYLDSWPASGGTTMVDVASAGLPVVSFNDESPALGMTRVVSALGDGVVNVETPRAAAEAVGALLADPHRRAAMGDALRRMIDELHGTGWTASLERVVMAALEHAGRARPLPPPRSTAAADWQCLMELMQARSIPPVGAFVADHAHLLPADERPSDTTAALALGDRIIAGARPVAGESRTGVPRALAQPELTADAVCLAVDRFRELLAQRRVDGCIVLLGDDDLGEGMRLLQAALDAGGDLDIEIVTGTSLEAVRRDGDLVVATNGHRDRR